MKLVIHSIEGSLGRASAMVVCPSPYAWVQGGDERSLIAPTIGADKCFHLFQVTLLGFHARFDDDLVSPFAAVFSHRVLPNSEAEKIKTSTAFMLEERVGDVGFAGLQYQTHFG